MLFSEHLDAPAPRSRGEEVLESEAEVLEADPGVSVVVKVVKYGIRVFCADAEALAQAAEVPALDVAGAVGVAPAEELLKTRVLLMLFLLLMLLVPHGG